MEEPSSHVRTTGSGQLLGSGNVTLVAVHVDRVLLRSIVIWDMIARLVSKVAFILHCTSYCMVRTHRESWKGVEAIFHESS